MLQEKLDDMKKLLQQQGLLLTELHKLQVRIQETFLSHKKDLSNTNEAKSNNGEAVLNTLSILDLEEKKLLQHLEKNRSALQPLLKLWEGLPKSQRQSELHLGLENEIRSIEEVSKKIQQFHEKVVLKRENTGTNNKVESNQDVSDRIYLYR